MRHFHTLHVCRKYNEIKSLKLSCALCMQPKDYYCSLPAKSSICRAREELQDNHWSIIHAFIIVWQVSYVTKAAGDCLLPNAPMPSLFVPVSECYSKTKPICTLSFPVFCDTFSFTNLFWTITKADAQKLILEITINWYCLVLAFKTFDDTPAVELPVKAHIK